MSSAAANKFRWIAMAILLLAAFMELLDVTIVNVAIPSLQQDLHMDYSTIQWMVAGYTLAFAVALVSGGRLGDILGRKRTFLAGMAVFMLASLTSGLSQGADWLIVSRLVQGLAAAMMMPQVMAYMVVLFQDGKERLLATGMYGGIAGLATVGGPLIGGILLENNLFGLSWRNIFFINIPVGIFSLAMAAKFLPESKSPHPLKVDWVGTLLLTAALLLLLFPIIQGRQLDWPWWGYVMMASSAPLLVIFWYFEKFKDKPGGSPLMVTALFKERAFIGGLIIFVFFFGAMGAYFLLSTLFLQEGLGFTPLNAGLATAPFSVGIALGAGLLVNVLQKLGRTMLILGGLILIAGFGAWVITLNAVGTNLTGWDVVPATLISGTGMGLLIASLYNFVLAGVKAEHAGSASGVLSTMQEIGSSLGIAVLGVLFFNLVASNAATAAQDATTMIRNDLSSLHLPAQAEQQIIHQFTTCYTDRANQKDPQATPDSCKNLSNSPTPPQVAAIVNSALKNGGTQATKDNFLNTFKHTLYYQMALVAVVVLLIPLLPKKAPTSLPGGV